MELLKNHYIKEKLILIILFISLTYAIISIFLSPTKSYELSIYSNIPEISLLILILIPLSITIILLTRFNKDIPVIIILFLILVLFLNRFIIQWLPFIRGYYTLSGDHTTQIGICKDIIQYGFINQDDFYPITHIFLTIINLISSISIVDIGNYSTGIISALSLLWIYILSTIIFKDRKIQIFCLVLASITFFSRYELYLMPNGWSIFYIPLILFLFFKSIMVNKINFKFSFLLTLIIIPYFHPLTSLYFIIIFLIIGFLFLIISHFQLIGDFNKNSLFMKNFPFIPLFILFISFSSWILSFKLFYWNIRNFINAVMGGDVPNFLNRVNSGLLKLHMNTLDFIIYIIKETGHVFIYIILSIISFFIFIKTKKYFDSDKILFILFIISGLTGLLYFSTVFNLLPGLSLIGGQRLIAYMSIFMPLFVGYGLYNIVIKKITNQFMTVIFIIFILIASGLSILSLHPSPSVLVPGPHVTNKDVTTAQWILTNNEEEITVYSLLSNLKRLSHIIFGESAGKEKYRPLNIADHFNFMASDDDINSTNSKKYMMITTIDKITYTTVWAPVGRFNEDDFIRLNLNPQVDKIYFNGEGEIWEIL